MKELEPIVFGVDGDLSICDHLRDLARSLELGIETFAGALGIRAVTITLYRGQVMRKIWTAALSDLVRAPENWATPPLGMSPPIPTYNGLTGSHAVFFPKKQHSPETTQDLFQRFPTPSR